MLLFNLKLADSATDDDINPNIKENITHFVIRILPLPLSEERREVANVTGPGDAGSALRRQARQPVSFSRPSATLGR